MRLEVYPAFSFHLQIDEFYAVDLVSGYYQVHNVAIGACLLIIYFRYDSGSSRSARWNTA